MGIGNERERDVDSYDAPVTDTNLDSPEWRYTEIDKGEKSLTEPNPCPQKLRS